ncbi:TonB-dependent siderophore receptor [Xanthomonas arboricola]|nr:TonB-dependent siderophore receptor [Xanthomonas arboricola]
MCPLARIIPLKIPMTPLPAPRHLLFASLFAAMPAAAQEASLLDAIVVSEKRALYRPEKAAGATRTQTPVERIPQAIQVVPRSVIDEQQLTRLVDVVANVSNVQPGGTQGNRSETFVIRGFEASSYAVDGILLNPAQNFTETVRDLANVAQVEVLKGPAAVLYGRGEPGGVINLVTLRPDAVFGGNASVQVAEHGLRRVQSTVTGPLSPTLSARLSAAAQETGSFRAAQADGDRVFVSPSLAWRPNAQLRADLDLDYTRQTSPGDRGLVAIDGVVRGPAERSFGEPWSRNHGTSRTARGRIEYDATDWLTLRQILNHQDGDSGRDVADFTGFSADRAFLQRRAVRQDQQVRATTSQTEALAHFATGPLRHQVLAGAEYVDAHRHTDEARAPLARISVRNPVQGALPGRYVPAREIDVDARYAALYVQDQISIGERWDVLAGVRWDDVQQTTIDNGARTREDGRRASPRIGVVWKAAPQLSLYANTSTSFRPRSATLFSGGSAPPETGRQYELGLKGALFDNRVLATAAAFQITKDNVATSDPDNSGFVLVTGQQRVRGLELDITGELTRNWRLILGAGYLDAQVTRDTVIPAGNRLRGVPRVSASLWSTYHVASGPLYGLTLGAGAVHVGEREGDLANSYRIAGYTRFDASAAYRFGGRYQLALMLRNVANRFYIEQPVTQTTNYPGAPRTLSATLSMDF